MQYRHNLNDFFKYNLLGYNLFPIKKVWQGNAFSFVEIIILLQ